MVKVPQIPNDGLMNRIKISPDKPVEAWRYAYESKPKKQKPEATKQPFETGFPKHKPRSMACSWCGQRLRGSDMYTHPKCQEAHDRVNKSKENL